MVIYFEMFACMTSYVPQLAFVDANTELDSLIQKFLNSNSDAGPAPVAQGPSPSLAGQDLAPGQGGGTPSPDQGLQYRISFHAGFR